MIEMKNVSFKYKNEDVIKNFSLDINYGESIALVGANGTGKSTFLKLLNGILFPSSGKYLMDEINICKKQMENGTFAKMFHKKIGFVFQNSDAQLFCSTVYEEIAFGPRQMGMKEEEVKKRVDDCMKLLNIYQLKHRQPYTLSGGEKKRVAIASVLSLNPEVLALDEPMSGIDPKGKKFLRELFLKLNTSGKTIICSTHDFEYTKDMFERAIVFSEDHQIIRDDSYKSVIEDDEFLIRNNIK
jgi:cobalt/nickel transport system ATP-binding protein